MTSNNDFERVLFTPEMKRDYTILIPDMLPMHFKMIAQILNNYGYNIKLLSTQGPQIADQGLRNVHNDTCYPALLVIGQFIDAIESGEYDIDKTALLITQTGGGCRASNYIYLLRKALKKRGYGHIPVISLNFSGLDKDASLPITIPMATQFVYTVLLGDLIMLLANQCRPYEVVKGETELACERALAECSKIFTKGKVIAYKSVKVVAIKILDIFAEVKREVTDKPKVGIVGEIYVKYSPLGNNNLEDFLLASGAEAVVPGLLDFLLYCVCNTVIDNQLYGMAKLTAPIYRIVYKYLLGQQKDIIKLIKNHKSSFRPNTAFDETYEGVKGYMSHGVKMGEGWLLTAEMIELIHAGVSNIVCTQPFGCMPNHIAGKGMIRKIKERNPSANIVAIDYDPGATQINQENRIKLMLSSAGRE